MAPLRLCINMIHAYTHLVVNAANTRACDGPFVWAGPGRAETFENVMGRAETSENLMGRAGPGREKMKM